MKRRIYSAILFVLVLFALGLIASGCQEEKENKVERFGRLTKLKPSKAQAYIELHANPWPEVNKGLRDYKLLNYTINMKSLEPGGPPYLFGYYEYHGDDIKADIAAMIQAVPVIREWEKVTAECMDEAVPGKQGWVRMQEVFYFAGNTDVKVDKSKVKRYGKVIGLKPEMIESYKLLHDNIWPEVKDAIAKSNIRNYAIFLQQVEGKHYLFSLFEYVGSNFGADMAALQNDPATAAWIKFTNKMCQLPIPTRAEGEWWASMEEIYHLD